MRPQQSCTVRMEGGVGRAVYAICVYGQGRSDRFHTPDGPAMPTETTMERLRVLNVSDRRSERAG